MLDVFQQRAGAAADNHRGLLGGQLLFERGHHLLQVVGVHHGDTADANGMTQGFQIHGGGGLALDVEAGGGVLLVAGHAGDGVVQHDNHGVGAVVGDVYQAGDAGVGKGGIANDGHAFLLRLGAAGLVVAVEGRHRRAHADGGVHGVQGGAGAQGVAADVAADVDARPL